MTKILIDEAVARQTLEALFGLYAVAGVPFEQINKKLLLEALDEASPAYWALRQALEQPAQQEPVAWRDAALRVGEDLCSVGPFGYYDMTAQQWLDWALSVVTVHSPPAQEPDPDELTIAYMSGLHEGKKRKAWVGLTDEEIDDIEATWEATQEWVSFSHATRVIEAKLKEKNQ